MKKPDTEKTRLALIERLKKEGAIDLAQKLERCGEPVIMVCTCCGHGKQVDTQCKLKWCPSCQRMIAARRTCRFRNAVAKMQWPLFVTFTVKNSDDPECVIELRKAFRKLRNRKIWKDRVKGGVAGIEVTNIGNGWHPHLHTVIDCEWLSITVPKPLPSDSKKTFRLKCKEAAKELNATWSNIINQPYANIKTKRAYGTSIVEEVLKYSVKGTDLIDSVDEVAPLIRVLSVTRLVTSFGNLHGVNLNDEDKRPPQPCEQCNEIASWIPASVVGNFENWSYQKILAE